MSQWFSYSHQILEAMHALKFFCFQSWIFLWDKLTSDLSVRCLPPSSSLHFCPCLLIYDILWRILGFPNFRSLCGKKATDTWPYDETLLVGFELAYLPYFLDLDIVTHSLINSTLIRIDRCFVLSLQHLLSCSTESSDPIRSPSSSKYYRSICPYSWSIKSPRSNWAGKDHW